MEQKASFTELFEAYKSNFLIQMMSNEQCENLQKLHEGKGSSSGISLSQSDFWMVQAGLVKKKVLSLTDTGTVFSRFRWKQNLNSEEILLNSVFRSFTLSEEEFLIFLEQLTAEKKIDLEEFKAKLLEAGPPSSLSEPPQNQTNDLLENQLTHEEPENLSS